MGKWKVKNEEGRVDGAAKEAGGKDCPVLSFPPLRLQVESRRSGGEWEEIGILGTRQFRDKRLLRVVGQPEVREYRLRFWKGTEEVSSDWSAVGMVTVSP